VEDDQFAGFGYGEGAQQDLVEQRKNSGCRSDAESQRTDGNGEKARLAAQRASREVEVASDAL